MFMWRKIKIAKDATTQDAFVTIGNGQIHFGIAACRLMPDCLTKKHVEFFRCDEDNLIGVHVIDEPSEDSVPMQRPLSKSAKRKNLSVHSFTVVSKHAIERVFGEIGTSPDSVKCKVTVDQDSHGMFVIDISSPRQAKAKRDAV
jgi:hypothetical protein